VATGRVGELPPTEALIRLRRRDRLRFLHGLKIGAPAVQDDRGDVVTPATIGCENAELFAAIRPGHRVLLDDGTIEAVVDVVDDGEGSTRPSCDPTRSIAASTTSPTSANKLDELGCQDTAVLKIEHASAFGALPELSLRALRRPPVAVMLLAATSPWRSGSPVSAGSRAVQRR
jgi:hypothetical protein